MQQEILHDKAVKIGDVMETAFCIMWYRNEYTCIWRLLELLEWEFQMFQNGSIMSKADAVIKAARAWRPKGGSRTTEAGSPTVPLQTAPAPEQNPNDAVDPALGTAPDWGTAHDDVQETPPWQLEGANAEWATEVVVQEGMLRRKVSANERSMAVDGLYTITVGKGAESSEGTAHNPTKKYRSAGSVGTIDRAEEEPTDSVFKSQGFYLLSKHAGTGTEEERQQTVRQAIQSNLPVVHTTLQWSKSAARKLLYQPPETLDIPVPFVQGGSRTTEAPAAVVAEESDDEVPTEVGDCDFDPAQHTSIDIAFKQEESNKEDREEEDPDKAEGSNVEDRVWAPQSNKQFQANLQDAFNPISKQEDVLPSTFVHAPTERQEPELHDLDMSEVEKKSRAQVQKEGEAFRANPSGSRTTEAEDDVEEAPAEEIPNLGGIDPRPSTPPPRPVQPRGYIDDMVDASEEAQG